MSILFVGTITSNKLLQLSESDGCSQGCLRCNQTSLQCEMCDSFSLYVLNEGVCLQSRIDHCEFTKHYEKCDQCKPNYFFNDDSLQCEPVTTFIPHCEYYSSSTKCLQCELNYQLDIISQICHQINPIINNCLYYEMITSSNEETVQFPYCLQCVANHYLSIDGKECIQLKEQNCLAIHNTKCIEFNPNYAYKYSYIELNNLDYINTYLDWMYNPILTLNKSKNYLSKFKFYARSKSVFNCLRLIDPSSCSVCQKEFSLNLFNLQCEYSPIKNIKNCLHFDSINEICIECIQSFILHEGVCLPKIVLENCEDFNSVWMKCDKCKENYFYSLITGSCQLIPQIDFCIKFNETYDKCIQCDNPFIVDNTTNKCIYDVNAFPIPEFCLNFNLYSGQCTQCKTGYILSSLISNKCVVSDTAVEHCLQFKNNDDSICEQCKDGYILSLPSKNECKEKKNLIINCQLISDDGDTCLKCEQGFKHSDDQSKCLFSIELIDFCKEVDIQKEICTSCIDNYIFSTDQKKCEYQPPIHCIKVDSDPNTNLKKCVQCNDNHILNSSQDTCDIKINFCKDIIFVNGEQKCSQCLDGYKYHDLTKICYKEIDNCEDIIVEEVTQQNNTDEYTQESILNGKFYQFKCCCCVDGYMHSSNKLFCLKLIDNCLKTTLSTDSTHLVCEQCADNYIVLEHATQCHPKILHCNDHFLSSSIVQVDDGTEQFTKQIKCSKCHTGFFHNLDQSECYFIINGCEDYQNSYNKLQLNNINILPCNECHDGLLVSENNLNCLVPIPFCLQHSYNSITDKLLTQSIKCEKCVNNYRLNNDNSSCLTEIPNCNKYSSLNHFSYLSICSECDDQYVLSSDFTKCFKAIDNCKEHDILSHLFNTSLKCLQCESGFELLPDLTSCVPLIPYCIKYTEQTKACTKCRSPFILSNSKCIIDGCLTYENNKCSSCKYGYEMIDNICYSMIEHCITYLPTQSFINPDINKLICTECNYNFSLSHSQTKCIAPISNCNKFSFNITLNSVECTECIPGYLLKNSLCSNPILNCAMTDTNLQDCLSCIDGFEFDTDKGYCVAKYCQTVSNNGVCLQCQNQDNKFLYSLNESGICTLKNPNCNTFADFLNQESDICQECKSGFSGVDCSTISSSKCIEYNTSNICTKCKEGYFLKYNSCFIENCAYLAKSTCYNCAQGFIANDDLSQCKSVLSNCKVLDSPSICSQCKEGFYLDLNVTEQCLPIIPDCDKAVTTANGQTKCVQCKPNYFYNWRLNKCVNEFANCETLSDNKQSCIKCHSNYELQNQCFTMTSEGCIEMEFGFKCLSCAVGYVYIPEVFGCVPSVFNCVNYHTHRYCSKCNKGLEPDSDGKCFSQNCKFTGEDLQCNGCIIDRSITIGKEEYCLFCSEGYERDDNYICKPAGCTQFKYQTELNSYFCEDCNHDPNNNSLPNNAGKCIEYSTSCISFSSSNVCTSCKQGFSLLNNTCFRQNSSFELVNCLVYFVDITNIVSEDTFCYQPDIGYYFDFDHKTVEAFINNCSSFENKDYCNADCKCSQCKEGFEIFKDNLGNNLCLDSSLHINRNNHESDILSIYSSIDFIDSYKHNTIINSLLQSRILQENTCQWDYYWHQTTQQCQERSVIDPACIQYHLNRDGCQLCKDNYYKTTTDRCGKMPHYQTNNCLKYNKAIKKEELLRFEFNQLSILVMNFASSDISQRVSYDQHLIEDIVYVCSVCEKGFYLTSDYKCMPTNTTINNCFSYDSSLNCLRCEENYYLKNSETTNSTNVTSCEYSSLLSNCEIATSPDSCLVCKMGFSIQIKQIDNKFVKVCEMDIVNNCDTFDQFEGKLVCNKCSYDYYPVVQFIQMKSFIKNNTYNEFIQDNFAQEEFLHLMQFSDHHTRGLESNIPFTNTYLNNYYKHTIRVIKQCIKVISIIEHCQEYDFDANCKFCKNGYLLTQNKKKCIIQQETISDEFITQKKCAKLQENTGGCNICQGGYYFNTKSDRCEQCQSKNCLICTQENSLFCQVCQKGFYMNSNGNCLSNPINNDPIKDNQFDFGTDAVQIIESIGGVQVVLNKDPNGNIICQTKIEQILWAFIMYLIYLI